MPEFSERKAGDVVVIDIKGEIKGGPESDKLHTMIREQLDGGAKKILLNMTEVPWVNSFGVGLLMACFSTTRRVEGHLALYGMTERVGMTLGITGLVPTIFEAHADEAAALAAF